MSSGIHWEVLKLSEQVYAITDEEELSGARFWLS